MYFFSCTTGAHNFRPTKKMGNKHSRSKLSQGRKAAVAIGPRLQKGDTRFSGYSHQDYVTMVTIEYDEVDEDLEEEYARPKNTSVSLADLILKK